jgi:hypothetical protein
MAVPDPPRLGVTGLSFGQFAQLALLVVHRG